MSPAGITDWIRTFCGGDSPDLGRSAIAAVTPRKLLHSAAWATGTDVGVQAVDLLRT